MKKWMILLLFFWDAWAICQENYETSVESDVAHYDGDTITLTGSVRVQNVLGTITAQKAILKRDENKKTRIDFPLIELTKNVTVTFANGSTIACDAVFVDYTEMRSSFRGSPQVVYSDSNYDVYADLAEIVYKEINGSLKPHTVTLTKNVKLVNRGTQEKPEKQYALADHVTYFFENQLMILEGKDAPVLFYDKLRDMQLSAKAVRASRDVQTKKEVIQGVGDVRFIFGPEEFDRLKKRFHWDESK